MRRGSIQLVMFAAVLLTAVHCHAQSDNPVQIERLSSKGSGGQGYRLVYWVDVPARVYWRFKTDFENAPLVNHRYIRAHRFVERAGRAVVTENRYTVGPDVTYRWTTTIDPKRYLLRFRLLNPQQSSQTYHYGTIKVDADAGRTRVTHVARFAFWGASFWAMYPWRGGMRDFLTYTARWERATVQRYKHRYGDADDP